MSASAAQSERGFWAGFIRTSPERRQGAMDQGFGAFFAGTRRRGSRPDAKGKPGFGAAAPLAGPEWPKVKMNGTGENAFGAAKFVLVLFHVKHPEATAAPGWARVIAAPPFYLIVIANYFVTALEGNANAVGLPGSAGRPAGGARFQHNLNVNGVKIVVF